MPTLRGDWETIHEEHRLHRMIRTGSLPIAPNVDDGTERFTRDLTPGDFNGDSLVEIALKYHLDDTLSVLMNNGMTFPLYPPSPPPFAGLDILDVLPAKIEQFAPGTKLNARVHAEQTRATYVLAKPFAHANLRGDAETRMTRRNKGHPRCDRCMMRKDVCLCALIPRIDTRTRLTLILHRFEARKPTNSGRLAVDCLVNSEIRLRGNEGEPIEPFEWNESVQPLLLFPAQDAIPLTQFANCPKPISLVVPDGTWRQAFKARARVPGLMNIPCVTLPQGIPTRYRLRAQPHEQGLGTMEAIARALGILEGSHVQEALERVFMALVERTLQIRGKS